MRIPKTKRNTHMRNLNNLGCTLEDIAKGFGLSKEAVLNIVARRTSPNPCQKHHKVFAWCPDCRRVAAEKPKQLEL